MERVEIVDCESSKYGKVEVLALMLMLTLTLGWIEEDVIANDVSPGNGGQGREAGKCDRH
jgi:hypothetical protein